MKTRQDRAEIDFNIALGERLCRLRQERGITQVELGRAAGLSAQQIYNYEVGDVRCAAFRLRLLARKLGVGIDDLLPD
jgi:transcriptional regulator with XRE-family HTH domain